MLCSFRNMYETFQTQAKEVNEMKTPSVRKAFLKRLGLSHYSASVQVDVLPRNVALHKKPLRSNVFPLNVILPQ